MEVDTDGQPAAGSGDAPSSVGWNDIESRDFLKALRAPLMVQTPLQVSSFV